MILFLTYLVAGLLVGLYIWWFVVRYRREQANKAAARDSGVSQPLPPVVRPDVGPAPAGSFESRTPTASTPSSPTPSGGTATTVAEALSGISMPHDLVPLTTMPPRPGVVDQVAFSSKMSADVVGPAFADELERLGYAITPLDERALAAKRGNDALVVYIHPEPPATAPQGSVVIEVCLPY